MVLGSPSFWRYCICLADARCLVKFICPPDLPRGRRSVGTVAELVRGCVGASERSAVWNTSGSGTNSTVIRPSLVCLGYAVGFGEIAELIRIPPTADNQNVLEVTRTQPPS